MKRIISISEVVDCREVVRGTREVIASGEAGYDESRAQLVMDLTCRALVTDIRGHETPVTEDWLPKAQSLREGVSLDEAQPLARELFHRWAATVRASVPAPALARTPA